MESLIWCTALQADDSRHTDNTAITDRFETLQHEMGLKDLPQ